MLVFLILLLDLLEERATAIRVLQCEQLLHGLQVYVYVTDGRRPLLTLGGPDEIHVHFMRGPHHDDSLVSSDAGQQVPEGLATSGATVAEARMRRDEAT